MPNHEGEMPTGRTLVRGALIVVASTLLVVATRFVFDPWLADHLPYLLFIAAVAASTRWAGWRAGIAAMIMSAAAGTYFFAEPRLLVEVRTSDSWIEMGVFAVVSTVITAMLEVEMRLRRKVQLAHQELGHAHERLRIEQGERLKTERELDAARRLESIGMLAGGIAHDFNNLLTVIQGFSELLRARSPDDPGLHAISVAATQAADLVKQLLRFARREPLHLTRLSINESIHEGEALLRRLLPEDVELDLKLTPDGWYFHGDRSQMQQVLQNLVTNARDAMPRGGHLSIVTDNTTLDGGFTKEHPEVTPGEYVHLQLSDTGHGLSDEERQRIFEPFYTTKEQGRGTGLGLSVVYGIIKQLHGQIYVHSMPGKGTAFDLYWPRVRDTLPSHAEPPSLDESAPPRKLTVLLVDDDELVLEVTVSMLSDLGHEVIAQGDPAAALRALHDHVGPIDVLVTDVVMPWMNGRELADRVCQERPGTPVVFISGYSDNVILSRGVVEPGTVLVRKPFSARELDQALRAATAEPRPSPTHVSRGAHAP